MGSAKNAAVICPAMLRHSKSHKNDQDTFSEDPGPFSEELEEVCDELVQEHTQIPLNTLMPVFDFAQHVQSPFNFLAQDLPDESD